MITENNIFHLTAHSFTFAANQKDWPYGPGWYFRRDDQFIGPFDCMASAVAARRSITMKKPGEE